jgi:hypothetical protein
MTEAFAAVPLEAANTSRECPKRGDQESALSKTTPRRHFLKTAAAATGGRLAIVPPLSVFKYSQVHLLDGPLKVQFDQNR